MSRFLFVGGPLDGQYREVEDPAPEVVPYLVEAPFTSVSAYQPDAITYWSRELAVSGEPELLYTVFDDAELAMSLRCEVCVRAGIFDLEHLPYPDAREGDDLHGQYDSAWDAVTIGAGADLVYEEPKGIVSIPFSANSDDTFILEKIPPEFPTKEPQTFEWSAPPPLEHLPKELTVWGGGGHVQPDPKGTDED